MRKITASDQALMCEDTPRTPHDWVEHINDLEDPNEALSVASELTDGAVVAEDIAVDDLSRFHLPRHQLIEHALEKHLLHVGSVDKFLANVCESAKKSKGDSYELKLITTDLIVRRGRFNEIQSLNLFLSANKDFVSEFTAKEISNIARELGEIKTARSSTQGLVSGVIEIN